MGETVTKVKTTKIIQDRSNYTPSISPKLLHPHQILVKWIVHLCLEIDEAVHSRYDRKARKVKCPMHFLLE